VPAATAVMTAGARVAAEKGVVMVAGAKAVEARAAAVRAGAVRAAEGRAVEAVALCLEAPAAGTVAAARAAAWVGRVGLAAAATVVTTVVDLVEGKAPSREGGEEARVEVVKEARGVTSVEGTERVAREAEKEEAAMGVGTEVRTGVATVAVVG